MAPVIPLRPSFVSVERTHSGDRPIAAVVQSRTGGYSALLTLDEARAVHETLGQLIRDVERERSGA